MKIPSDWDKPGKENADRVRLFHAERYIGRSEILGEVTIPYRFFVPNVRATGEKFPLVLYLHGADAVGMDNEKQLAIHDIGTVFAAESRQKYAPCYILAPQYHRGTHWAKDGMPEVLHTFIEAFIGKNPMIDRNRIYIYGYSAGGIGTFRLIKSYPSYFAAALPICGATIGSDYGKLSGTPMWMFHAIDDLIVPAGDRLYDVSENEYHGSHSICEKLGPVMGEALKYTEYKRGYMTKHYAINPHCTWVPAGECEEAHRWLFSQKR